jgi:outer membrane receptor protein involved in Fe transport
MQDLVRPSTVAALVSLVALPCAAQTAQPAPPQPAPQQSTQAGVAPAPGAIEQIVVTANKRREAARTVANSVTALSGRELDRKQQVTLQDLAAEVPGLSLEVDDKSAVRIVLRGLNTGGVGVTVASLLDDVPANPSGAVSDAAINTPNFDTYDLQRIEVLRGPQSTLYGATAEGGLIKYVTNPPDPTGYHGQLEAGVDGAPSGGPGGSLKGFVNIPIVEGVAALRLTGWNEWMPGYVDNPTTGRNDSNSWQQYGWRASLLVTPVDDLSIRLTAQRQSLFSNNADYVQVQGAALDPAAPPANQLDFVHGLSNPSTFAQPSQNEAAVYYANVSYDFGWSSLTSITGFTFGKFQSFSDVTWVNAAPGLPFGEYLGSVYGVPTAVDERQNSNSDKFSQEVRLASDPGQTILGNELTWLGGVYYTHETETLLQYLDARNPADLGAGPYSPATGGVAQNDALSEWAFFGQADYHFLPSLDLELGGRWSGNTQVSQNAFACCLLYGPSFIQPDISSNDHDALYSVALRWRPTDATMLYTRIATGYRPGGPNAPVPGVSGLPTTYGPDRTVNYEVGVRQDFLHDTLTADITGYYINWKDVQILSLVNTPEGPVGINGNAGDAVSKGVEWDFVWAPLPGLQLSATGDYTDARLTVNAPGLGGAAGDFLPYVPNVSSNLNAEYSWTPMDGFRAYISGTWSYTGERYTSFAPAGEVAESHVLLPNYNTGALRAGLEHGLYSGELYVNNISNSHAITYYANQGGLNETGLATIIQPLTIGFVVRAGF